jgi:hypothetical protein
VVFDVIGPDYDATGHDFECNSGGATAWGTSRYLAVTEATGGLYAPIEALDAGDCAPADIGSILEEMF